MITPLPVVPAVVAISYADRLSTYTNVSINGAGNAAKVPAGSSVNLSFNQVTTFPGSYCPTCIMQVYVGLGGSNYSFNCVSINPFTYPVVNNFVGSFTAPIIPGTYYLTQANTLDYFCVPVNFLDDPSLAIGVIMVGDVPYASDNCTEGVVVTSDEPECFPLGATVVTFTATDDCGNTTTCTQTVTVTDTQVPSITCPEDVTIECSDYSSCDASGFTGCFAAGNWNVAENGGSVTITSEEATLVSADNANNAGTTMCIEAPSDGSILFNWYYHTDDCCGPLWDNFGYAVNNVFVQLTNDGGPDDQSGSVIVSLQAGDIFCFVQNTVDGVAGSATTINASFIFSQSGVPVVSDNCSLVDVSFSDQTEEGDCTGSFVITRTWTATDAAGNTNSCDQIITIEDTTPPSITTPASNPTVQCDPSNNAAIAAWLSSFGGAVASDLCSGVMWSYQIVSDVPGCGFTHTLTVNFIATDECGNPSTTTGVFTIIDNTAPSFIDPLNLSFTTQTGSGCPMSTGVSIPVGPVNSGQFFTVDGNPVQAPVFTPVAQPGGYFDICSNVVTLTLMNVTPGGSSCTKTYLLLWKVTDACNNMTTQDQLITVIDNTPPVVTPPAGFDIECSNLVPAAATTIAAYLALPGASISDNCQAQGSWTISSTTTFSGTECNGFYTRTYTIGDGCGNNTTATQVITVSDNTVPTITCSPNITVPADQGECTACNVMITPLPVVPVVVGDILC
jgi:hypothetical protein